ncbi:hypothetical protein [Luteolibacter soli]|uniref:Uncharacterized protein n=1 Tax=Luteolibacter soli TaxID=3135280 RepID=A0ABU9AZE9_9BACT
MLTTEEMEVLKDLAGAMRELAESNRELAAAQIEHAEALFGGKDEEDAATLD